MSATEQAYKPMAYNTETKSMLQNTGFVEIKEQIIKIPFNPWSHDAHERDIGRWFNLGLCQGLEAFTLAPMTRILNWDRGRVARLVADVKREICTKRHEVYCEMHIWTARRPA